MWLETRYWEGDGSSEIAGRCPIWKESAKSAITLTRDHMMGVIKVPGRCRLGGDNRMASYMERIVVRVSSGRG